MKNATKDKLFEAWAYCDEEDKSTEFMLQYMQDSAKVNLDTVLKFIETTSDSDRRAWYKKQLTDTVSRIINGMSEKELIEYIDEQDDIRDSAMEEVYKAENIDDFQWLSELVSIPVRVANRRLRSIQSEFERLLKGGLKNIVFQTTGISTDKLQKMSELINSVLNNNPGMSIGMTAFSSEKLAMFENIDGLKFTRLNGVN
jgi:hypothetical protein